MSPKPGVSAPKESTKPIEEPERRSITWLFSFELFSRVGNAANSNVTRYNNRPCRCCLPRQLKVSISGSVY